MNVKSFEWQAIDLLVKNVLPPALLSALRLEAEIMSYEYSASGYYLTLRHPGLPADHLVCSEPLVLGIAGGVECGFIVFLGNGELMLECHSDGFTEIPESYREQEVQISTA